MLSLPIFPSNGVANQEATVSEKISLFDCTASFHITYTPKQTIYKCVPVLLERVI